MVEYQTLQPSKRSEWNQRSENIISHVRDQQTKQLARPMIPYALN